MLVYFNEMGQIERQLEYGQLAYLSTTNYTVFIVQEGYQHQEGDVATLSLKRPDGTIVNAEIWGEWDTIVFDKTINLTSSLRDEDCLPFIDGHSYSGFRFNIDDMNILDQTGTWRATVSINPHNTSRRLLSGLITIYVLETEINIDGFEMSYSEYTVFMNRLLELETRFQEEVITSEIVDGKIDTALSSGTRQIKVPVIPVADNDAASKDYVDYVNNTTNLTLGGEIQNVREVAAGKKNTYVSSVNYVEPTEISFYDYAYYRQDGTRIVSYEDFLAYIDDAGMPLECANADFGSESPQVSGYGKYLIVDRNQNDGRIIVKSVDNFFKRGDELYFIELLPVLDRWYSGNYTFSQLDTKVDLSTVVHKSGDETISGVKNFTDTLQVKGNNVENGLIKEINAQYVRIWNLDVGIYKLTYNGTKYLYYNGASGTQTRSLNTGVALLQITNDESGQKSWLTIYTGPYGGSYYGKTTATTGEFTQTYNFSPIYKVNKSTLVADIYAPTTKGYNGQVLTTDGGNTPTWDYLKPYTYIYTIDLSSSTTATVEIRNDFPMFNGREDILVEIMPQDMLDEWVENNVTFEETHPGYFHGITFTTDTPLSAPVKVLVKAQVKGTI